MAVKREAEAAMTDKKKALETAVASQSRAEVSHWKVGMLKNLS